MDTEQKRLLRKNQNSIVNYMAFGLIVYSLISLLVVVADTAIRRDYETYWSTIAGVIAGLVFLFVFYRRTLPARVLFQQKKRPGLTGFLEILCVFSSAQLISSFVDMFLEYCLNLFGFSFASSVEQATATSTEPGMFLYACLIAPVAEEIVYRGFCLRFLSRFGNVFAIVFSAALFGIMHANLPQALFAFHVGLVLGYVTVNYSIHYAILLHVINNFLFGDVLDALLSPFPVSLQNLVFYLLFGMMSVCAVCVLFAHRKDIRLYLRENPSSPNAYRNAFTAILVIIFILMNLLPAILLLDQL